MVAAKNTAALEVWTIGHSTHPLDEFLAMLAFHGIEGVADVRRHAGSRKYPHFNPDALRSALSKAGVEYVPLPELGGRRQPRADSRNTVWRNASFRGYADYMETEAFQAGLERLLALARRRRTAIMCAEAVWWRCHRSLIADLLKARGVCVRHIANGGRSEIHPYTSAARLENGELTYSPER
ncbi:hypothetical protein CDO44_03275 [Pigmentiphaga sp. NML080357]|uniref:DUF488 domain-containing protein n=1 Tax=Pigmentiphaga sp. NML080357 TaxID=2008675 RepID=UPI000B41026C|nr:DUF488 domain-containing protein [Pigmentiphaga sp. NML080357]OVZ63695.1 hypothetical protein CDO44_03275 [Pigmentiphaga sp. NML080357]